MVFWSYGTLFCSTIPQQPSAYLITTCQHVAQPTVLQMQANVLLLGGGWRGQAPTGQISLYHFGFVFLVQIWTSGCTLLVILSHWFVVQNKYIKLAYWWMPLLICQFFHSLAVCNVLVSIGNEFSYLCISLVGSLPNLQQLEDFLSVKKCSQPWILIMELW